MIKYSFATVIIFFVGLVTIFIFFSTTSHNHHEAIKTETIHIEVTITRIDEGKYTNVYGQFSYAGKIYHTISTNGYYYKRYNLVVGQKIPCDVKIYFYKDGFIEIGEMVLNKYELNP